MRAGALWWFGVAGALGRCVARAGKVRFLPLPQHGEIRTRNRRKRQNAVDTGRFPGVQLGSPTADRHAANADVQRIDRAGEWGGDRRAVRGTCIASGTFIEKMPVFDVFHDLCV